MSFQTDLSKFENSWYKPGGNFFLRFLWLVLVNPIFFKSSFFPSYGLKRVLLKLFGAKIGTHVLIKPSVNIKYPWRLKIGDFAWIGENVWIDNLGDVEIQAHACLSQGAMLLTGNHNYKKSGFDLMVGNITIGEGAWVGAQSVVCPGVSLGSHAILSVGSVATKDLKANGVYQGVPAIWVREREITE